MKILNTSSGTAPSNGSKGPSTPSADLERVDALEKIVRTLLQRMQTIEDRLDMLELQKPGPAPTSGERPEKDQRPQAAAPIEVDHAALKKGLGKMWKYLKTD